MSPESNQQQVVPPATTPPGQETPPAAPAPSYITQEQFQAALDAQKKEFEKQLAKNYQGTQSLRDQVNNRVAQMEAHFKNYGVPVTPEMKAQMQNDALLETLNTPGTPAQEPTGEEREPTPEEDAVYHAGEALAKHIGVTLEDNDPEVAIIDKAVHGTEEEYLAAWVEAATAKKARLANTPPSTPQGTPPASPEKTAARLPALGGGGSPPSNPIAGLSQDELWRRAKEEGKF